MRKHVRGWKRVKELSGQQIKSRIDGFGCGICKTIRERLRDNEHWRLNEESHAQSVTAPSRRSQFMDSTPTSLLRLARPNGIKWGLSQKQGWDSPGFCLSDV
jgi:hypothetical protein